MKVFVMITGSYDETTVEGVFSEEGMHKKIASFSDQIDAWYDDKLKTAIKVNEELEQKDMAEKQALKNKIKEKEMECNNLAKRIENEDDEVLISEMKKRLKKIRHEIGRIGNQIACFNFHNHYYGQDVHDIKNWTKEKKISTYLFEHEISFVDYIVEK